MYWFPSASHILAPSPRTMNGASHSTALNARTGELTPPGINCSARFCRRRHSSSFRGMLLLVAELCNDEGLRSDFNEKNPQRGEGRGRSLDSRVYLEFRMNVSARRCYRVPRRTTVLQRIY